MASLPRIRLATCTARHSRVYSSTTTISLIGRVRVVTPEECIEFGKQLHEQGTVMVFNAMLAGLSEELSWSSLELFVR